MKLCKKLVNKDGRKYFYTIGVVNELNRLTEAMVNADGIHTFKRLYDSSQRDGAQ